LRFRPETLPAKCLFLVFSRRFYATNYASRFIQRKWLARRKPGDNRAFTLLRVVGIHIKHGGILAGFWPVLAGFVRFLSGFCPVVPILDPLVRRQESAPTLSGAFANDGSEKSVFCQIPSYSASIAIGGLARRRSRFTITVYPRVSRSWGYAFNLSKNPSSNGTARGGEARLIALSHHTIRVKRLEAPPVVQELVASPIAISISGFPAQHGIPSFRNP